MFSFKNISTVFTILILWMPSVHAGVWQNFIDNAQFEEAQIRAKAKLNYYKTRSEECVNDSQVQVISTYIADHFPELNPDIVSFGLKDFFVAKQQKWKARIDYRKSSQACDKWQKYEMALRYACASSVRTFFHQQAIKALEKISTHTSSNDMLAYTVRLLIDMNVDKEVQKLNKLHTSWNNELKNMMGMEPDLLSKPYKSKSIVVMLDRFKKDVQGMNKPWGIKLQPEFPKWKTGDPLNKALGWEHGDSMTTLKEVFSPQTEVHRVCNNNLFTFNNPFLKNPLALLRDYYNDDNLPAIVNYSYCPTSVSLLLQKTGQEISLVKEYLPDPLSLQNLRKSLEIVLPYENWQGPLNTNQLALLEAFDALEHKYKDVAAKLKELIVGSGSDQSHLLMASPSNQPGPLTRTEFHSGKIHFLEDDQMKDHALIALNYNLTSNSLWKDSHSAGEYKDMSVVVPAAYISVLDGTSPIPYFSLGGHSSATAILSHVTSIVCGHYPELNRQEIRKAILEGANKNFPGYMEEMHGQGMLNLKGALAVAEKIRSF